MEERGQYACVRTDVIKRTLVPEGTLVAYLDHKTKVTGEQREG